MAEAAAAADLPDSAEPAPPADADGAAGDDSEERSSEQLEEALAAAQAELDKLRGVLSDKDDQLESLRDQVAAAEGRLTRTEKTLKRVKDDLYWETRARSGASQKAKTASKAMEEMEEEVKQYKRRVFVAETKLNAHTEMLEEERRRRLTEMQQVYVSRVTAMDHEEKLKRAKGTLRLTREMLEETKKENETRTRDLDTYYRLSMLDEDMAQQQDRRILALNIRVRRLENSLKKRTDELQVMRSKYKDAISNVGRLQRELAHYARSASERATLVTGADPLVRREKKLVELQRTKKKAPPLSSSLTRPLPRGPMLLATEAAREAREASWKLPSTLKREETMSSFGTTAGGGGGGAAAGGSGAGRSLASLAASAVSGEGSVASPTAGSSRAGGSRAGGSRAGGSRVGSPMKRGRSAPELPAHLEHRSLYLGAGLGLRHASVWSGTRGSAKEILERIRQNDDTVRSLIDEERRRVRRGEL